jgi:hypothetical protein
MFLLAAAASAVPPLQQPLGGTPDTPPHTNNNITQNLFDDLEELARIVDIAYCVGTLNTGVDSPFQCLSYCRDFPSFELVQTWNTGMTMSDSCGYIAVSHPPAKPRIIVAFRGTYSLINALADLSVAHQDYLPYPSNGHSIERGKCEGCTVHSGFLQSWSQTEKLISPVLEQLLGTFPRYQLTLVGHSLGGAVAGLAGLDFHARGWDPTVTTFGEPKSGNEGLAEFYNKVCFFFLEYSGEIVDGRTRNSRERSIDELLISMIPFLCCLLRAWDTGPTRTSISSRSTARRTRKKIYSGA